MGKDVFISYKAEEFEEADWVKTTLEQNGISCWMAPACIPGGASYASEIPAAIRSCKVFVLILSRKCQESKWVPRELDQAINDSKIIMPFMIENCPLRDEFNFYLSNVQRYAAYESKSVTIGRMIKEIKALLEVRSEKKTEHTLTVDPAEAFIQEERPVEGGQTSAEETGIIEEEAPREDAGEKLISEDCGQGQVKEKPGKRRGGKMRFAALAVAGVVLVCAAGLVWSCWTHIHENRNRVMICGNEYNVTDTSVYLSNLELDSEDIKNLSAMKSLRVLSIENCVIKEEDLSDISGVQLTSLYLSNCNLTERQIQSLDFSEAKLFLLDLSGNSELKSLDMMEPLKESLNTLKINNTSVSDIGVLAAFSRLTDLQADNNAISDISALSGCTKLSSVSLNGNEIADLSAFQECSSLQRLYINANKLKSLNGLERCIELRIIEAGLNEISSLEGLSNATVLERVFLNDNKLEDISVLAKSASHVQRLYLRNNSLSDISCLKDFTELRYLSLDNNNITTLAALANSKKLEGVSAMGNKIESTRGIEGLTTLKYLYLADNEIKTVGLMSPLTFVKEDSGSGVCLDLSGNDLVLVNMESPVKFRFLGLVDCPVPVLSFLYKAEKVYLAINYDSGIDFSTLKENLTIQCMIVGCPLDQQLNVKDALGSMAVFVDSREEAYNIEDYLYYDMIGNQDYYQ